MYVFIATTRLVNKALYKATTISPGLVASYNIGPGNGVGLFGDTFLQIQAHTD